MSAYLRLTDYAGDMWPDSLRLRLVIAHPNGDWAHAVLDTERDLTRGQHAKLRARMRLAVMEHRHAFGESVTDMLAETWVLELREVPSGARAWALSHESCALRSMPRYQPRAEGAA